MSSLRNSSSSSNKGTQSSSIPQKKPSLFIRFVKSAFFQMFVFFMTIILLGVGYAAWTTINPSQGADGQPVTQTLMQGIINNINDLGARVTTLESGATTGGTVTGPLRWSSEYSGQNYTQAWNTCLAISPAGSWRVPSENDIEYGRHANATLFAGNKYYWSSVWDSGNSTTSAFLAWNPTNSYWKSIDATNTVIVHWNLLGINVGNYPLIVRCVSNS